MEKYDPKNIESKWQKYWAKHPELVKAKDVSKSQKKYILDMFPYPSGDGLHTGHVESYTATDITSRYLRLNGYDVLHPQGWDAFGLPAENFAIKTKIHPSKTTKKAIATFKRQMQMMGLSYDWSREVNSSEPDYYKWTQWFFLLLYKNKLAYKAKAKVNWCDSCKTVLANEQVEDGRCERCKNPVRQKDLEQWFFKITDFIEDKFFASRTRTIPLSGTGHANNKNNRAYTAGLISGLEKVDWPESTKAAQKNWIGRSEGAVVKFPILVSKPSPVPSTGHPLLVKGRGPNGALRPKGEEGYIEVFTTRLDTIYGCTYCVVAPEHPIVASLLKIKNIDEIKKYLDKTKKKSDLDRMEAKIKTGVEIKGIKVINPFTKDELPLWVADYVLSQYGTGAVMAVPAHDERDWEFAKKYKLPIRQVIEPCFWQKTEPGKIKEDKPFVERDAILAIVKHWKEDKYLALKWKKVAWHTFITGGPENGQSFEEAARNEILEETGYKNLKLIKKLPMVHAKFYHVPKEQNRFAHFHSFCFKLQDGEQDIISEKEKSIHEIVWLSASEIEKIITAESQKYSFNFVRGQSNIYTAYGILNNSGEYSGMDSHEAKEKMAQWLEKNNLGAKKVNYKIRDWLVSRQRYWGAPIPIIYCDQCGEVPVPEKDLPVKLPTDVDFLPTGESPLKYSKKFQNVRCPKCKSKARRESDTMDTFVCSSWYYFRYADPKNSKKFADPKLIKKWLPVDLYVGGAEHTVLHLLYSRFFTKVLHNLGYIDFDEPFSRLRHQGIILAEDGRKMSKSLGNVVNPDVEVKRWGADSLRMFEMFMGPLEDMKPWNTKGIVGVFRFLEKVWKIKSKIKNQKSKLQIKNKKFDILVNKTIKKVTEDIEIMRYNTAISALMVLTNEIDREKEISITSYQLLLTLLSPFAPFISEELWSQLGHKRSIFLEKWPGYDPKLICDEEIELVIQINGKLRDKITVSADISEEEARKLATENDKIKAYTSGKEIRKIIFVKGRLVNIVI
jgi:leucyl-tRNA synthetase